MLKAETQNEKALLLLSQVQAGLLRGDKFRNLAGEQLLTPRQILLSMHAEGGVQVEPAGSLPETVEEGSES